MEQGHGDAHNSTSASTMIGVADENHIFNPLECIKTDPYTNLRASNARRFPQVSAAATMAKFHCTTAQRTLMYPVSLRGIGVHSGRRVNLTLRGADIDSGIRFLRTDVPAGMGLIPATWDRVSSTRLSTVLSNAQGISVSTVEHLMAALRASGVDNALVELDGPEIPIVDGSAAPWVSLIHGAGTVCQAARRRAIRVHKPIQVGEGDQFLRILPAETETYAVEIEFADPAVGYQRREFDLRGDGFPQEIAPARTFGFLPDIQSLRSQGLTLGGSLDNAVVVDEGLVLNEGGLRFADEFVRHKILDCIGDLSLAGARLIGRIEGRKVGHGLNNQLLRALFAQPDAWSWEYLGLARNPSKDGTQGDRLVA